MLSSEIINIKNNIYFYFQNKCESLVKDSVIFSHFDEILLFFIGLTLLASTFLQSEKIGLLAFVVVVLTLLKLFIKKGSKVALTKFDGALIVYFLIAFISTINSSLLAQSIHGFLKTVIYILYYFSVVNYFQSNQSKIKGLFIFVAGLCCFEGMVALVQNLGGVEQIATWQDSNYINPEDAISRAYGTLKPYNPNLLGGYLVAGFPYVLGAAALLITGKSKRGTLVSLTAVIICALAILVTGSRGAYLGLGATIAALISVVTIIINADFSTQVKLKAIWHKIVAAIIASFALILVAVPKVTKRLLSIFILRGDSSTSFRMNVYNSSWQMFCDNWFLGIGAGNQTFREIYGLYMLTGYDALSTYSVPLEIAVECGIFGLLAFTIFIVWFMYDDFKFIRLNCSTIGLTEKIVVCSAILLIIGVMTHGLFDTIFYRPQVQFLFWTMIAMASATIKKDRLNEV